LDIANTLILKEDFDAADKALNFLSIDTIIKSVTEKKKVTDDEIVQILNKRDENRYKDP